MDRGIESADRTNIHWDETDLQALNSAYSRLVNVRNRVSQAYPPTIPTPEIDARFAAITEEDRSYLERAVVSNIKGVSNNETRQVNYRLLELIHFAGRVYFGTTHFEQTSQFAVELFGRQVDQFAQQLDEVDRTSNQDLPVAVSDTLHYLSTYIVLGKNGEAKKKAIDCFKKNADLIQRAVLPDKERDSSYMNYPLILQLYALGDADQKQMANNTIVGVLKGKEGQHFLNRFVQTDNAFLVSQAYESDFIEIIRNEINRYGFDTDRVVRPWLRGKDQHYPLDSSSDDLYARRNSIIRTLKNLEIIGTERAKVLQEMFGINHFGRYPLEILIKQYDRRNDSTRPYGVILGPTDDRNDWMSMSSEAYQDLFKQLGDDFNLRVTECESSRGPRGIGRRLREFRERYNPNGKGVRIGFLIIQGHANRAGDRIWLGADDHPLGLGIVRSEQIERDEISRLQEDFVEHPDIVIVACFVGKNFAKRLSNSLNARVFAQTGLVQKLIKLGVQKTNGRVNLNPVFAGVNEGADVVFNRGEEITGEAA